MHMPDVNRCGAHDDMVGAVGKLEGTVDILKGDHAEHSREIQRLHERISNLKQCFNELKIDMIKTVNRNNLKLVSIVSPLSGIIVAVLTVVLKTMLGGQ